MTHKIDMNEKLEKTMREFKNSKRTKLVLMRIHELNISRKETPKHANDEDAEIDVSDSENQENGKQGNLFKPSETNEFRTTVQPLPIQYLTL